MARAGRHAALVAALATYCGTVGTASAHGFGGGGRVGFAPVVGLTVGAGVLVGVVAAVRGGGPGRDLTATLVGPALVALGALAALAAASRGLVVAGGGLLAGALAARAAVRWVGDGHAHHRACAGTALGGVAAHRVVEGLSLAAAYATGSAVGLLGAAVLAGHATAETAAVGGLFGVTSRSRGVAAVGVVQAAFLAGAAAGVAATTGLSPLLGDALLAAVGGVLLVAGGLETAAPTPDTP